MKHLIISLALCFSQNAFSVGSIQDSDVKSASDLRGSTLQTTGNLTSGSACIVAPDSTDGLAVGQSVYDITTNSNIPGFATGSTTIAGLPGTCPSGQIQMSANAAGSGTMDSIWFGGSPSQQVSSGKIWDSTLGETVGDAITNGNILNSSARLSVPQGGTGQTNAFIPFGTIVSASGGLSVTSVSPGTSGQLLISNGPSSLPSFQSLTASYHAPTVQNFFGTNYYSFTISGGGTWAIGDTYTNNGQTFTSIYASTVNGSTVYVASATGAPAGSGTLTRSSGSGSTTITFSGQAHNGTYYPGGVSGLTPIYVRVRVSGGGAGGAGGGIVGAGGGAGVNGSASTFANGGNSITCNGGVGGAPYTPGSGGTGGTVTTSGTAPIVGLSVTGGGGMSSFLLGSGVGDVCGGSGGSAGAGGGNGVGATTGNATAGSRGGGGGGGANPINTAGPLGGGGGGGGGYIDGVTTTLASSYTFTVGAGGAAGTTGTSGTNGAAGGDGFVSITEYYQ